MKLNPTEIFAEYKDGTAYKSALGNKGLFEQSRINERFYIGDQWHGAKCGNERPLVRHNVIKRIGDYKISQVLSRPISVDFSAEGVPSYKKADEKLFETDSFSNCNAKPDEGEINRAMALFGKYHKAVAERIKLSQLNERILKNAYISGTSVLYTYWDSTVPTGLFADYSKRVSLKGDICCEVLDIRNVVFGDPYCEDLQNQPYIILSSNRESDAVIREARLNGADAATLMAIEESAYNGKITVLTKLYKSYRKDGSFTVKCVKVTERAVVRPEFDTGLRLYPLAVFCWERKANSAYGESEITFLIPNQIAINRMITANVWSAMTTGMPIMLVNGDTVTDKITNEPGQIIKVFGNNEDVAGAVKYISPSSNIRDFDSSINTLIENTLTQSGANQVALGDSQADNATALAAMRDAALTPLQLIKNRFYIFTEDVARIWVDFWVTYYGKRLLKVGGVNGNSYLPFDGARYKELVISAKVDVSNTTVYSEQERMNILITLFEKGIIDRKQFLTRMPKGSVPNIKSLLEGEEADEGV